MLDTPVDLDLTHELLFGATLGQTRLLNNLGCVHESCVGIDEFVAFGKTTLSEELSFNVSSDTYFSAFFLKFLLNDGLRGG